MNERTINKLRKKFILISMLSLFASMMFVAGLLYLGNLAINIYVVRDTLDYIIENDGNLINTEDLNEEDRKEYIRILEQIFGASVGYASPEFRFTTRYFAVIFDEKGNSTDIKINHIAAVSRSEAEEYAMETLAENRKFGRKGDYYYKIKRYEDGSSIVVYLDSTDVLGSNNRVFFLALMLIGAGMIIAFLMVRFFSYRVIQNEVKTADLQKQFMTNASHELKTPLAVIRANTEMQEILGGENEWTQSTLRQVERMSGLIKNLVMITRAEENFAQAEDVEDVDVTKSVLETAEAFRSVAVQDGKQLLTSINENVHIKGEDAKIRQLCSLLVDNAIKYCDENGEINVSLTQKGKGITLTVSNSYAEGKNVDYTKFFERFYREDKSHNVDKGGYGIGLSIAESLVKQYRGSIDAQWSNGKISFICQLKPILV